MCVHIISFSVSHVMIMQVTCKQASILSYSIMLIRWLSLGDPMPPGNQPAAQQGSEVSQMWFDKVYQVYV